MTTRLKRQRLKRKIFGYRFQFHMGKALHPGSASKIAIAVIAVLAYAICIFFGELAREDALFDIVARQAKSEGYMQMLKTSAPSLFYEKPSQNRVEDLVWFVLGAVPAYSYAINTREYATQSESEISYEAIIAKEAADENYVDETTGRLVVSDEKGENDALRENPNLEERKQSGEETELPGVFVPNDTPVVSYSKEKLNDFDYLIQNFYVVDRTTTINSSQLNAADLLSRSMKLSHGPKTPQILIYHTHSKERFADSAPEETGDSIVGVGEYLTQLLGNYGLNVLHHTGEYDAESRDGAYAKAGPAIEQILKDNPGIEVVIDLHRDGVAEGTRLVTDVQGKQMASIMFFNGLSRTTANGDISYLPNPYIQDNLAFSLQMQIAAEEYYPGFSRAIYLKGYRYNMHYCPKTLLVEAGAQTNTVQEIKNAMEPLADLIAKVVL